MDYTYILVALALILGGLVGYFARQIIANQQIRNARKEAQKLLEDATTKYNELLVAAREEASRVSRVAEAESRERRLELQRAEKRFSQKEETLERKLDSTERRERNLESKEKDIERTRTEIEGIKQKQLAQLEFLAGIPQDQAKNLLLQAIRQEVEEEASRQVRNWQAGIKEEADKEAQRILATAIQRCTTDVVSQTTVSTISLPSDEMK